MIKIEVTGNSIPEVADKLLAIGASLRSTASNAFDDAARVALQAKRDADKGAALFSAPTPVDSSVSVPEDISPAALEEVEVEVAEAAPVDPTSSTSAIAADVLSSQPTTKEPSTTPAPAPSASDEPAEEIAPLNFETQVAPVVLLFVQKRSKEETSKILAEFGVERASMLNPALWPELVARLEAEMA